MKAGDIVRYKEQYRDKEDGDRLHYKVDEIKKSSIIVEHPVENYLLQTALIYFELVPIPKFEAFYNEYIDEI